jgi:hypothetical protein
MSTKLKNKEQVVCPVCKGTGCLPDPLVTVNNTQRKHQMVKVLYENGFSYREIAKHLGYKSVNSVSLILKK